LLDVAPGCPVQQEELADFYRAIDGDSRTPQIVVNLSELDLVTSGFLAGLVGLWKRARSDRGKLVLCGLRPVVREVFAYTRLDELFEIRDDELAAIHACGEPASSDLVPS
jgi:anti-anti-sigma factor